MQVVVFFILVLFFRPAISPKFFSVWSCQIQFFIWFRKKNEKKNQPTKQQACFFFDRLRIRGENLNSDSFWRFGARNLDQRAVEKKNVFSIRFFSIRFFFDQFSAQHTFFFSKPGFEKLSNINVWVLVNGFNHENRVPLPPQKSLKLHLEPKRVAP